jgi:hypothetical protein
MKTKILSVLLCILLSGCIVHSLNVFYTPDLKVKLPEITGEWILASKGEEDLPAKNPFRWNLTENEIEMYDDQGYSSLKVVFFKIGKNIFMDFTAGNSSKKTSENENALLVLGITRVHSLCKVLSKGDELTLVPLNFIWFRDRIKENKLNVSFVKVDNGVNDYIFTASPKEWVTFLEKYGNDHKLFMESESLRFVFKKQQKLDSKPGK